MSAHECWSGGQNAVRSVWRLASVPRPKRNGDSATLRGDGALEVPGCCVRGRRRGARGTSQRAAVRMCSRFAPRVTYCSARRFAWRAGHEACARHSSARSSRAARGARPSRVARDVASRVCEPGRFVRRPRALRADSLQCRAARPRELCRCSRAARAASAFARVCSACPRLERHRSSTRSTVSLAA
jgi:hypothetical protein